MGLGYHPLTTQVPKYMPDKYDDLIESERDYEEEDYYYELQVRANIETKEKQEQLCYAMKNMRHYTDYP